MKRFAAVAVVAAAAGLVVLGPGGVAGAADEASVSVVHGIPDTPVNVFVNGDLTLRNFRPGTVAGPLSLPAGSYEVKVFPAANTAGTGNPVIQATARVPAGANVTPTLDLRTFAIVDVSQEKYDGDQTHSQTSVLRGTLS